MKHELILGIETTCDETSVALLKDGIIIDLLTHSQIPTFKQWGGVVPQIASDLHVKRLPVLIQHILAKNQLSAAQLTMVAYADHPGLEGCLQVGRAGAKTFKIRYQIPILPINHLEAHFWIATYQQSDWNFPALGAVISGGHTQLFLVPSWTSNPVIIGATKDDAAGECIDKLARYLGLEYPGGPRIEKLAQQGQVKHHFPVYQGQDLNFSFSGLKTACLQWLKKQGKQLNKADFAAALEAAIFTTIEKKIKKAVKKYKIRTVLVGGGVAANQHLRTRLQNSAAKVLFATKKYCTDNGAMIAYLGWIKKQSLHHEKNSKTNQF